MFIEHLYWLIRDLIHSKKLCQNRQYSKLHTHTHTKNDNVSCDKFLSLYAPHIQLKSNYIDLFGKQKREREQDRESISENKPALERIYFHNMVQCHNWNRESEIITTTIA